MNENLQRLSVQITSHQYKLLKHFTKPGTSISSIVRHALDDYFIEADQALQEKAFEAAEYEEYEKYMLEQKEEPVMADASVFL
tara:strand:+ start:172 stop:420 length:249 start_codon:yes stop_codon:yes gene_type:complete